MTNLNPDQSMLEQAINDYLGWMIAHGYAQRTIESYESTLKKFCCFVKRWKIPWDDIFTLNTLKNFQAEKSRGRETHAIRGVARLLYQQNKISQPIPVKQIPRLPEVYEEYFYYCAKARQDSSRQIHQIRKVLSVFNSYLEKYDIRLSAITIEQFDAFSAEFNAGYSEQTQKTYLGYFRGFLKYLYQHRNILKKDLAPLIVSSHGFARTKPPCFLRPHEVQRLFAGLKLSTPRDLRTYAMIHLAYTLGLRPTEICRITLDDISFNKGELRIRKRKTDNPIVLPVPKETIKAIAAYLVGGRHESKRRELFLSLVPPYGPVTSLTPNYYIKINMRKAKLPATASVYWLRHTYAQNLLEAGVSIFEIKEMLGHDNIASTGKYLRIHINLMRKVLFDETI